MSIMWRQGYPECRCISARLRGVTLSDVLDSGNRQVNSRFCMCVCVCVCIYIYIYMRL